MPRADHAVRPGGLCQRDYNADQIYPPDLGFPGWIARRRQPLHVQAVGSFTDIVPHADLLPHARKLASRIMQWSPAAVTACLRSVTRGLNMSIDEGLAVEASQFAVTVPTPELRQGLDAFLARRAATRA